MNSISPRSTPWKRSALLAGLCLPLLTGVAFGADTPANWKKHCASCHGPDGKGQTKAGKKAGVKDQTDPEYQKGLTDEKMFASIKEGLKEDSKVKMQPFAGKLNDEEIKALVGHIRSFAK